MQVIINSIITYAYLYKYYTKFANDNSTVAQFDFYKLNKCEDRWVGHYHKTEN